MKKRGFIIETMKYNVIIVGAGFTGSVIARQLSDRLNMKSLVIEKRNHIAGNMYDKTIGNNVFVHMYGPHSFFTDEKWIVEYIQKFAEWKDLNVTAKVEIDHKLYSLPFGFSFIREYYPSEQAQALIGKLQEEFSGEERVTIFELLNSKEPTVVEFAKTLCEKDYYPYSSKQWGIPMDKMDSSVIGRVKFALSEDNRYIQQKYQLTPVYGFTAFFEKLLGSPNITVVKETDALEHLELCDSTHIARLSWNGTTYECPVVFTGPIDELFGCRYGALPYRSLEIQFKSFEQDSYQDVPFISYPQADGYTRIVEYKKLTGQEDEKGTVISVEYPEQYAKGKNLPYYPIINAPNLTLYDRYHKLASEYKNLFVCGRLGDYKYYNMDAAIVRAMEVERQIEEYLCKENSEER